MSGRGRALILWGTIGLGAAVVAVIAPDKLGESLKIGLNLLYKALWPILLGVLITAAIETFVDKERMAQPGAAPADQEGAVEEEVDNALEVGPVFEGRGADIVLRTGADTVLRKPADTLPACPLTFRLRMTPATSTSGQEVLGD